jgi:hypothetical protein
MYICIYIYIYICVVWTKFLAGENAEKDFEISLEQNIASSWLRDCEKTGRTDCATIV